MLARRNVVARSNHDFLTNRAKPARVFGVVRRFSLSLSSIDARLPLWEKHTRVKVHGNGCRERARALLGLSAPSYVTRARKVTRTGCRRIKTFLILLSGTTNER